MLGADQIPADLIPAGGKTLCSKATILLHLLEELRQQQKESVIVPFYKKGNKIVLRKNYSEITLLPAVQHFIEHSSLNLFVCSLFNFSQG